MVAGANRKVTFESVDLEHVASETTFIAKLVMSNSRFGLFICNLRSIKTNCMLFGSRMFNKEVNIKMQNVNIERVRVTKYFGVFIDELLNWKAHIKYV